MRGKVGTRRPRAVLGVGTPGGLGREWAREDAMVLRSLCGVGGGARTTHTRKKRMRGRAALSLTFFFNRGGPFSPPSARPSVLSNSYFTPLAPQVRLYLTPTGVGGPVGGRGPSTAARKRKGGRASRGAL